MPDTTKDPVCAMEVDRKQAIKVKFGGRDFYFCSDDCKMRFGADPAAYTTDHA